MKEYKIVLVTGGTCSGKSEFVKWFRNAVVIELDNFYRGKSDMEPDEKGKYDFDTPDAVKIDECAQAVKELVEKGKTTIPLYEMFTSERKGKKELSLEKETKFIIIEGIFTFYPPLASIGDMKIFIDTPMEVRLARRMVRDITRKGKTKLEILSDFIPIEQSYQKYIEPMKEQADLIIPFSYNPLQFVSEV